MEWFVHAVWGVFILGAVALLVWRVFSRWYEKQLHRASTLCAVSNLCKLMAEAQWHQVADHKAFLSFTTSDGNEFAVRPFEKTPAVLVRSLTGGKCNCFLDITPQFYYFARRVIFSAAKRYIRTAQWCEGSNFFRYLESIGVVKGKRGERRQGDAPR